MAGKKIFCLHMDNVKTSVAYLFFRPLLDIADRLPSSRSCPRLTDIDWLQTGVRRVLSACDSGLDFLSQLAFSDLGEIGRSHFFETLKSTRRLSLCQEAARLTHDHLASVAPDRLASIRSLEGFAVFAGDGHWHAAAAHDPRRSGKKHAVGHLYGLDLRHNALFHLQAADQKKRLKEHDMSGLKRTAIEDLRRGAPTGKKVLWIWDRAGIDFRQWYRWKQGSGIYFLSHAKENMRPEILCEHPWDRADAANSGVLSDREVSTSQGVSVRQIIYTDPATGGEFTFITNLPTSIPPGVVAQLYRMRWDAEKVFDELKNKLGEDKGWASSATAKAMQASFLCMAHNLIEAESIRLERDYGVRNVAEYRRKEKRLEKEMKRANGPLPELHVRLQRLTQHSVKFIRWLRYHLWKTTSLHDALPQLRNLYARL